MLVLISIKPKDHNLTNVYFIKLQKLEFFDTNYLKCSKNFAADCMRVQIEVFIMKKLTNIVNNTLKQVFKLQVISGFYCIH